MQAKRIVRLTLQINSQLVLDRVFRLQHEFLRLLWSRFDLLETSDDSIVIPPQQLPKLVGAQFSCLIEPERNLACSERFELLACIRSGGDDLCADLLRELWRLQFDLFDEFG